MKQIKESGIENPDITDKIKKKKKKITKEDNVESDNLNIITETKEVNSDDNKKNKVKKIKKKIRNKEKDKEEVKEEVVNKDDKNIKEVKEEEEWLKRQNLSPVRV